MEKKQQKGDEKVNEMENGILDTLQSIDGTLKRVEKLFLNMEEPRSVSVQISERNSNDLIKEHA